METREVKLQELSGFSFWNELAPLDHHWTLIGMVEAHKQPEIDLPSVRAFRLKGGDAIELVDRSPAVCRRRRPRSVHLPVLRCVTA